jgi:hypothetical protein
MAVLGLVGLAAWDRQRALADASAGKAADEAEALYRQARYPEALAVSCQAVERLPRFGDRGVRERVIRLSADVALVHRLEEIRLEQAAVKSDDSGFDRRAALPLFREAFLDYGVDVLGGDEEWVVSVLRRSMARPEVLAALVEWWRMGAIGVRTRRGFVVRPLFPGIVSGGVMSN